ncbi:hypothetical protein [Shivajiella indica]|uniref:DUF3955 domain-containing protein n=1 Tax=Shivajiella indica TaxID=872115 RepID=A0ABW5B6H3_9BACT
MEKSLKRKWLTYAVGGILLMGFGLSLLGEAGGLKISGSDFFDWFGLGTLALAVFFAGLSLFVQAVVFKSQMDNSKKRT